MKVQKRHKRFFRTTAAVCIAAGMILLSGCGKKEPGEEFKLDIGNADSVTIYYGENCYSFYSEKAEDVRQCADFFQGLRVEDTEEAINKEKEFSIYFTGPDGQNALVCADDSGVLWTGESQKFYKIVSGSFQHEELLKLYLNGMYADGFDGNMCTVPSGEGEGQTEASGTFQELNP
ncbi:hypothetical protein [Clostridium sp. AM58-1XD]|uniref:hypothetical protein n=1 Tax=Clostridium sp. AM58-1XD TaxID=2292307 RepID=UPI000E4A27FD|nr:hypothetical protein [Clostridium sp. AM58-1XD]RGZ01530.1 hypothetical protein DXA13_01435 [Clostridium sp. AM58-1XD]